MAIISLLSLQALCFPLLFFLFSHVTAQTGTDFSCSSDSTRYCDTYIVYRAQAPDFLDLGSVSDLFEVSRLSIKRASNLVSVEVQLLPDQLLLVPVTCGCTENKFFANITYQIEQGDSFYLVSVHSFENLTNYHVVQDLNPTLNPNLLQIGVEVVFPIFCKCPTKSQLEKGYKFLITYVWQPDDDVLLVSSRLNASAADIVAANNYQNFSAAVGLPVLVPVMKLPVLLQPTYSPPPVANKSKPHLILSIVFAGGAILTFVLICLIFIYYTCYRRKTLDPEDSILETIDPVQLKKDTTELNSGPRMVQDKLLPGVSGYLGKAVMYETEVIMKATMNFDEQCRIGRSFYRATIEGNFFAVKKTKEDVTNELWILQKVNHANLVKLMGVSTDTDEYCFLVYEFAENGSLDKWLSPKPSSSSNSVSFLTWDQRLNIALDVANGLQYLHEHTQPRIVHMDIRTANILLDSKFKAKIANFSMAKPVTDSVMLKADVFAFGVVLLELLSGKKAMETKEGGEMVMMWKEIRMILEVEEKREERLRRWMDPTLKNSYPIDSALSLAAMARACTWEKSSARPNMAEIVFNFSVLNQQSSETLDKSWISGLETQECIQVISPVAAR
ncbi:Protein kinase domain [Macleaya cordata]|uniref:Protein kinase domain n=1 Tax=Macleaya cordata TaxID=56857 RepID=A0A200R7C2_MACCD|nr:Protein kinase domain [Macleaya cordata]